MLPAITTTNEITARLADHARHARGAYAPETERAVRNDTAIFSAWCTDNDHQMLPASAETLVAYIDAMSATRAPATIRRYIASIAHLHRAAGLDSPTTAEIVKMTLKRITKARGARQRQSRCERPTHQDRTPPHRGGRALRRLAHHLGGIRG